MGFSGAAHSGTDIREVVNAVFYVLRGGCQWRLLPKDFPPYQTVYDYFRSWRLLGTWERLHDRPRGDVREAHGRNREPSAGIIESQTVKTTEKGGSAVMTGASAPWVASATVTACGGNTGWHHMLYRAKLYAPHLSNYSGAAGGRTFPSAAGFHTSNTFFTDDEGVYLLDNRDAPACADWAPGGSLDFEAAIDSVKTRVKKLCNGRLGVPPEVPYVEAHNTWVVNRPGTLLVIPVADLAQHLLLALCYFLQNGAVIRDDVHDCPIPGIEKFKSIVNVEQTWPLTFVEQWSLTEVTAELSTSCYAGVLMLQAMGLGGWMFNGMDPFSVLGASGNPAVPGIGFRFDTNERWPYPNPTGLEGVMEGFCPPHFSDMREAVEALCARKFGPGGPFHPDTPGPWKDSGKIRSAAPVHSEEFKECVALQAQYIFDRFGKFPGTVPSMIATIYLQAHHLDLEFYDDFYKPGAYLRTHAHHMARWHGAEVHGAPH